MSRLLSVFALVGLAACGSPVKKMCANLEDAAAACAVETTTPPTTETGTEATCETLYENCSDADLDLLNGLADCIAADCEDLSCYDGLGDLSGECLGLTETTPVTTTP